MNESKVSVIIPTYLRTISLSKAIESVLNQTFQEFEIIVVNDGSNETETINILNKFRDARIKHFCNSRKKGANGARNTGILNAKGKYIAMLDDDDIFLPTKLEKQYNFLENKRDIGVVITQADVINEKDKVVRRIDDELSPEDIFYNLIFNNCVVHCSVMFRKDIVVEAGYYDENLSQAQDYDLWCRFIRITKFFQINEKLVLWRDHPVSITGSKKSFQKLTSIYLVIENLLQFTKLEISPVTISKLQDRIYENIFELKETISIFHTIFKCIIIDKDSTLKKIRYKKKLLKKAMFRKIESSLYVFFIEQPKRLYIVYFLLLPYVAKKVLIKKLIQRVTRKINLMFYKDKESLIDSRNFK
ncbi:MAG: glycosyltransferase [Candidatus Aminicenantes bacterium]|nr:glycosyltransferase [Candidatus Aminicenantes bacterium]